MSESKAITYDDKFIDPPKSNTGKIDKYLEKNNDVVTQQFDLSKNMDYLQGWENPLTYQGGNNVTNIQDPFEELRAQRQPVSSKLLSGTGRVSTKVLGEIAKMPAYIGGLVGGVAGEISDAYNNKNEYSFTEQAFNNGWIRAVENLNQNINQDYLPVYVKKSVQEGNLWDNISSVDFWATEGADGIGFMASMLVPGAVLKSLGLGTKMSNATSRLLSLNNQTSRLAKVARGVEKMGIKLGVPSAKKLDVFNATVANTYLEAAAESGMAMDSFEKEHKEKFIENELALGKTMEEAEDSFNTQKAILGRDMFISNAMLLLGPNAIQSSMMFGKGTSKLLSSYSLKDASKSALKRVAKNIFSEGFVEEAGQSAVESYFKNKASKGQLKGDGFMSLEDFDPKGLKDAYLNTISSVDGQKAIFLGAVLGSTMSVYQGRKEDISNKKETEESQTLTKRYDGTLRALVETDVYKRNSEGEIEYDMNNNPIVNKRAIIEKFKTIDSLSHRFDEYDEALESGDTELLEKSRNKTIQDVMLPFVKEGEIGIESLSKYYDTMLESEEIQSSESFEEIKARKEEVLKIAKDVSKKYENYSQFALGKFNIDIPTENKEQLKILNELKKQYFNKLSSSYAMAEIERKQVESKLQKVNKEISYLEDINKIGEVTTEEAINADWSKDINKEIPNNKRTELASKNEAYRDLLSYKKRLEDKFNEVEKEIADNYFDNKKIKEDFIRQNSETVKTEDVENEATEDVDDFIDPNDFDLGDPVDDNQTPPADTTTPTQSSINNPAPVNNETTTKFEEPVLTEEEKIDKALEVNETDEIIKEIQSKIKDQEILTKEQLDSEINELYVDDELKEAISLILTDERDGLEDQESFDNKNKAALSELEGIDEEEMKVSDVSEDVPLDESYNEDVTVEDISINENSKIKGHLLMSLNKLFQPIFDNLKEFINYEKEPRNKVNDDVSFSFGDLSNIKEPTIKAILDKVKSGKKLIKSELEFLKNNQEYLENNLPIEVTISNGKKSAKTFLTALGSRTGVSKDIFIKEELPLRKSIIKKLIDNNFDFSKFKGSVKYQGKGKLNLDNFNTNNNVLDLSIFKNMSNKEKVKYFQDNTFYVNTNRELVNAKTKQPTTESFNHTLKGLYPGDVFLITTRPNGEKFPLKLNNNRLSREKANSVVKVLSLWSNLVKNNLNINGTLESFLNDNLGSDIEYLKSELELVKDLKLSNIQKLETLLSYVINTQNNNEVSKFYLDNKGNLVLGSLLQKVNEDLKDQGAITYESRLESIGFVGFNYTTLEELYKDDLDTNQESVKEHLINFLMYKKFSIKNEFANSKYVEHVLGLNGNESLVSTNVDVTKDMFEGYSNIFLNNEVVDIEEKTIKNEDKQIEKTVIPTQSFQGYPAPTPTNENTSNKAEDLVRQMINGKQIIEFTVDEQNLIDTIPVSRKIEIQSEIENNTENIRNSQENSVSLPDSTKEVVDNSINTNNLTDSQKKNFNKVALKLVDKSVVQEALKLKTIDEIFNKLKSELTTSDLNETLNTVCKN